MAPVAMVFALTGCTTTEIVYRAAPTTVGAATTTVPVPATEVPAIVPTTFLVQPTSPATTSPSTVPPTTAPPSLLDQFNAEMASSEAVQYMQLVTEPGAPYSLTAVEAHQVNDRQQNVAAALDEISNGQNDFGSSSIGAVAFDIINLGDLVSSAAGGSPSTDGGYAQQHYSDDLGQLRADIATAKQDLSQP